MDQSFLAGVGNIYADEALWATRLHPLRSVGSLRPADEGRLYRELRRILGEAVERRGSSIDDYTAPDGDGSMQERLLVYQRAGEPCPRCGRPIRRIVVGGRATHSVHVLSASPVGRAWRSRTVRRHPGRRDRHLAPRGTARRRGPADRADPHEGGPPRRDEPEARASARRDDLMSILRLEGVVREIGTLVILDQIDAAIAVGDRIGLVGPNGAGKTTLLRIAAGLDEPDRGTRRAQARSVASACWPRKRISTRPSWRPPTSGRRSVTAPPHLERMEGELATLEARRPGRRAARTPTSSDRFDVLGGYTLDLRVDEALSGLGFARDEWTRPPTALSGGQQTRAALARLVVADPDLLLLDEPTNHLDLGALEWLEDHLRRRAGSLLVASHDRAFLDATVSRVWELRDRRLTVFRGDYSAYHRQREERDVRAAKEADTHGRGDRAGTRARPALPEPPQVREDARARGSARATPGRPARGAADAPSARAAGAALAGGGPSGRARSSSASTTSSSATCPAGRHAGTVPLRGPGKSARDGAVPRRAAGRTHRHRRAERGRQDDAPADDRR